MQNNSNATLNIDDQSSLLIAIANYISLFICGTCILTQIFIHLFIVPKFHVIYSSMESADLPEITNLILNYPLLFQIFFSTIFILLIVKEYYIKDNALKIIINLGYLIIVFSIHIALITIGIFMPIMAMQKAAMGE